MKRKALLLALPALLAGGHFLEADTGFPKASTDGDDFEVSLSARRNTICLIQNPSEFYVILKNKTSKPQRLFEFWNSWGYQNISFYFYTESGVNVVTRKGQDFTRNFPSTNEVAPGEMMVFPIKLDDSWEGFPSLPEGESNVRLQVVYTTNPSFDAKEQKAWVGIEASKIYGQKIWRRPAAKTGESTAP